MNSINKIVCEPFGVCDGKEIFNFRLTNVHGNYVELLNYGAIVKSIVVPDKNGIKENVVLGFHTLEGYLKDKSYIGATVGRFANRINNAQFSIENKTYYLDKNELKIKYLALADEPTPLNFTNHSYFNLSACKEKIQHHILKIEADKIVESTADYIPTGKILPAENYAFQNYKLGDVMKNSGLNTYYIFNDNKIRPDFSCELFDEKSGRKLLVKTTYPGVQLYTGDYLNSTVLGEHGKFYEPFDGVCLECQYYPDSPNHAHFPNTIFEAGQVYNETIIYAFDVMIPKYATDYWD